MEPTEVLERYHEKLAGNTEFNFQIQYFRPPNALDFIMEGEQKLVPRAVVAYINGSNRIEITCSKNGGKTSLSVDFLSEVQDFTQPGVKPIKQNIYLNTVPSHNGKSEEQVIQKILSDVTRHKEGILKLFKPSRALAQIVGKEENYRYVFLDRLSKHIQKNSLVLQNGDIKIDAVLRPMFGKNVVLVNENEFFLVLRKNIKKVS